MKSTKQFSKKDRIEFWSRHVKAYSLTGLTQRAYCREKELSYWSFNTWKRKLEQTKSDPKFVELTAGIQAVPICDNICAHRSNNFEIILRNGLRIEIPYNFNIRQLHRIIKYAGEMS